jgi:drug/metabolite transporter (DMT)-like permease
VWGYNWVPLHILLGSYGPASLAFARILVGSLVLFVALALLRRSIAPPKSLAFVPIGLLQMGGMTMFSTLALSLGGVSRTAILVFTMPFWATLISRAFFGERIGPRRWFALCIAVAGLGLIAFHGGSDSRALFGALFAVCAGASWAAGSVLAKRFDRGDDLVVSAAWQQLVASAPLLVFALVAREAVHAPTPADIGWFVFVGAFGSGLGWLLWGSLLSRLPAPTVALGSLAIPIIAALAAFVQLGERPDAVTLTGLALVLVALVIATVPAQRATRLPLASQTAR